MSQTSNTKTSESSIKLARLGEGGDRDDLDAENLKELLRSLAVIAYEMFVDSLAASD